MEEFTMSTWNNITSSGVAKRTLGIAEEFREFILRGNVVDLAVGIVIGAAFTTVINGFVNDIISPLIPTSPSGLAGLTIHFPPYSKGIFIGAFINAVISFLIVALIIFFFVVKPVNALT